MDFLAHIAALASQHEVTVMIDPTIAPDGGAAVGILRMIVVYPIIDETTYLVALHELGHVVAEGGHGAISTTASATVQICQLMDQEDAAWAWARANAAQWTELMEHWAGWARETYRSHLVRTVKAIYVPTHSRKLDEWK